MNKCAFKVLGHRWVAIRMSRKDYYKLHGRDSVAMCIPKKREIHFLEFEGCFTTAKHEVYHSYLYEHFPEIMQLDYEKFEELCCEVFARYSHRMTITAQKITDKILSRL